MREILQVNNMEKFYGNKDSVIKAVNNISFVVKSREYIGIMGASGSGKTALLNCISTIDNITSGSIKINGKDITKMSEEQLTKFRREELGFIFQDFNLINTLTARDNIALALGIAGADPEEINRKINKIAKELDVINIINKYPYEISGGQKQRIACARAIITNPSLILADEPTGALDSKSARILLENLEFLNKDLKATILMVTHDAFAASYCKRIIFIRDGEIFNELIRGNCTRKEFFDRIIKVTSLLGGDGQHVF